MANEIAKAYVQIVPSTEGIAGSISSVLSPEATAAGLSGGTAIGNGVLGNMKKVLTGTAITAAVSAVVKALKACVDEASEFDASMSQVAATMGTTTDEISELTEFAKEMGRTTAFSAQEAAEGLNTLAMAGLDADEQMEVLPTVLNLAAAGCIDLDDAASYVTGTIKGFGSSMEDAEYYADLMAKGATLANTNVNDLGESMSDSAATAASYGQEADSVTLSLLRLAEQNVTGSEAATALNRAMADLYTPTDAARQALDELGVSCYDASGEARDFNDIVDELDDVLSGYDTETRKAYEDTIFTTRGMQAFDKMCASSTETVEGFKNELADCSGSAMQQAETQLDNLQGDVTLFKSAMSGAKIAIGEALTPMLRDITQFATNAVTAFTDVITGERSVGEVFSDACQKIAEKVGFTDWESFGNTIKDGLMNGLTALVQDTPAKMSEFVRTIDQKIKDTDWHAVGKSIADMIINGLVSIIKDIPGRISEVTGTIVEFLRGVDWQQVGYDVMTYVLTGLKMIVKDIPQAVMQITQEIINKIRETDWIQLGKDIVQGIIDGITNFIPEAVKSVGSFCKGVFNAFTDFFKIGSPSKLMEEQGGYIVEGLTAGMGGMAEEAGVPLRETFSKVKSFGSDAAASMAEAGSNMVSKIGSSLSSLAGTVESPLAGALSGIRSWGKDSKSSASDTAAGFVSNVKSGLSSLVDTVTKPLNNALNATSSWGNNSKSTAKDAAKGFADNINTGLSGTGSDVSKQLQKATDKVSSWSDTMKSKSESTGTSFTSNLIKGMKEMPAKVKSKLGDVTSNVSSWDTKMSSSFTSTGKNIMQGMINGINNKSGSLYSTITSVVNTAISRANKAAGTHSPSTKMAWTGEMMDRGLAGGLEDYSGLVEDAMDDVMGIVDAEADPFVGGSADYSASSGMGALLGLLEEYLPLLANMQVVMDTGSTVGALAPKMNTALGKMAAREARMG